MPPFYVTAKYAEDQKVFVQNGLRPRGYDVDKEYLVLSFHPKTQDGDVLLVVNDNGDLRTELIHNWKFVRFYNLGEPAPAPETIEVVQGAKPPAKKKSPAGGSSKK